LVGTGKSDRQHVVKTALSLHRDAAKTQPRMSKGASRTVAQLPLRY